LGLAAGQATGVELRNGEIARLPLEQGMKLAQRSCTASARKADRGPAPPKVARPIEGGWRVRRSSGKRYSVSSSRAELGCGL